MQQGRKRPSARYRAVTSNLVHKVAGNPERQLQRNKTWNARLLLLFLSELHYALNISLAHLQDIEFPYVLCRFEGILRAL